MCGIFGVINKKIDKELARKCTDMIAHRGPDGSGVVEYEDVIFGHRRLSILDLSEAGSQPMWFADRYLIVFNGEIYNFLEIRKELESLGHSFNSESDTEVLLKSYVQWSEKCLDKFNGMWAFAIYDKVKRITFMARDRFGVKPFFYTYLDADKTQIAFGSEMKALFPVMADVRPNRKIVTNPALMTEYEDSDECVIENIHKLPKGHYAYVDKAGMRITKYWETLDNIPDVPKSYEEQVEMFRELFLDACKLRMRSDVTIGTALSGGLDSSATICSMAHLSKEGGDRMNKDWQHAYVATFPGTTLDESKYAKAVTDYLGIKSTEVVIDPAKAVKRLDEYIRLFEEVYLTSPIPMMELYHALRQDNTLVTIDGHGADELFGGYTFDFINALDDARGSKERNMILDAYIGSFPNDGSNMALGSNSRQAIYLKHQKRKIKKLILNKKHELEDFEKHPRYKEFDTLNKILYKSSHKNILPTLLRNYDHYAMASGVEIRMPFMDYRIVSFAFAIDFRSKLHGGYSKSIIRDALSPYMPHDIAYRRTKIGFNTPIVEWMQGPLAEYFMDQISSADFANCDLIDPVKTRQCIENVIKNSSATFAQGEQAFSMIYPYLWEKALLKNK